MTFYYEYIYLYTVIHYGIKSYSQYSIDITFRIWTLVAIKLAQLSLRTSRLYLYDSLVYHRHRHYKICI